MKIMAVLGPEATAMIVAGFVSLLGFTVINAGGVADDQNVELQTVQMVIDQ